MSGDTTGRHNFGRDDLIGYQKNGSVGKLCNFFYYRLAWPHCTFCWELLFPQYVQKSQCRNDSGCMNKTDTIVDFLQTTFKIVVQNLKTSNTEWQRQHEKTFRILEWEQSSCGVKFFRNENTWYWRHTESQFLTVHKSQILPFPYRYR